MFWELGNEYNFRPEWFDGDIKKWYRVLNTSAEKIHELDAHHPVATAHGELPDSLVLSMTANIDIWGMNVYRWDQPSSLIEEWKVISKKPMYFSEAGADSYMVTARDEFQEGENQQAQAIANGKIIDEILRNPDIRFIEFDEPKPENEAEKYKVLDKLKLHPEVLAACVSAVAVSRLRS